MMHTPRSDDRLRRCLLSAIVLTMAVSICLFAAEPALSPWTTLVVGEQTEAEQLATIDLQRYVAQVSGMVPQTFSTTAWQDEPRAAVIVGTPKTNPLLADLPANLGTLGNEGFCLAEKEIRGARVIVAAGTTPVGAVNAIYGLLREAGFGFYLGSEAVPEILPASLGSEPIIRRPVLGVRGVLPWYNFFNSPTVWDPIDHRAFVDQLIRMGANFVGYHTYDSEPFAAYAEDGHMKWGGRLLNTGAPTWGTHPTPTSRFAFGIDRFFADDFFGAASALVGSDADEAVRREQGIMREALGYARSRGLHTCLGFEIGGDPTNSTDREVFLKRLDHVLDAYPALDYVWIWQSETQGVQGFREQYHQHILPTRLDPHSALTNYGRARRDVFKRIVDRTAGERPFFQDTEEGRNARAIEGARLEQFGQLACRALSRRQRSPRLIISGWGGDERLLSAEYYDGLDKLLPADVIFASLDHIWPRPRVDAVYHELPPQRERWPIPWLELDGDQWHPQPFVHLFQETVRDIHRGGSQGVLGIHWRTREVEENFGYLVDYAWQPGLTAEEFFAGLARRCYPAVIAADMAAIHSELDSLGYRWVGGFGQAECAPFNWDPGQTDRIQPLQRCRERLAALLPNAGRGRARAEWLIARIDWVLSFQQAQLAAVKARDLLARAGTEPNDARQLATEALALLDNGEMARALHAYAQRVSTRGEYGVLATINTKAINAWRDLRSQAVKLLGEEQRPEKPVDWSSDARIILPRLHGSTVEGDALELRPIVAGDAPAWIHYRKLGDIAWTSAPLDPIRGWVRQAVIPAPVIAKPGVEFAFSFTADPAQPMTCSPAAITVMPRAEPRMAPPPIRQEEPGGQLTVTAGQGGAMLVELTWNELPQTDYYRVYTDGKFTCDTAICLFPDSSTRASVSYEIEAWRDGKAIARSAPVRFTASGGRISQPSSAPQ